MNMADEIAPDDPPMSPAPPVSLADCERENWQVTANCEPCRILTLVTARDYDPVTAGHPLADAWAEGWITCRKCREPYAGLEVEDRGNTIRRARIIERCSLPGEWPDPEYRRRWRGGGG